MSIAMLHTANKFEELVDVKHRVKNDQSFDSAAKDN